MNMIEEKTKPTVTNQVVVYSGRFQPFHAGHYAVYKHLVSKFGKNSVFIGSSNDTSGNKSPFTFNEKKQMATELFDVPKNRFIKIVNPYKPVEILKNYDKKKTQYITVVGEKDADRLGGKYFKPYKDKMGYGYGEIGYVYKVPPQAGGISATEVRKNVANPDKDKAKAFFKKVFPKFDSQLFMLIRNKVMKMNEAEMLGLPAGYPSKEDMEDIAAKNRKIRSQATTDKEYVYDPIAEILATAITEEDFNNFVASYFVNEKQKAQKSSKPKDEIPSGLTHLGYGYYGKENGQATHRRDPDTKKIRQLSPDEIDKNKAKVAKKAGLPSPDKPITVKKDATGKSPTSKAPGAPTDDKTKGGADTANNQVPADSPQKIKPADFKTPGEVEHAEKQKVEKAKEDLTKEIRDLDGKDKEFISKNMHAPDSPVRSGWKQSVKNGLKKVVNGIKSWAHHKADMIKGTGQAVYALAHGKKIGTIKNKKTGKWEYSDASRKNQIKQIKHFAIDTALIAASLAVGGAVHGVAGFAMGAKSVGAKALAQAAGHGIEQTFTHSASGFAAHLAKDVAKHSTFEVLGLNAHKAAGAGSALSIATGGLLEAVANNSDTKFANNVLNQVADKMQTLELTDEQLLKSVQSYKEQSKKKDTLDLFNEQNESLTYGRVREINQFVEWATQKLKLENKPSVKLVTNLDYAKQRATLGGYSPDTKDIIAVTDGRLIADILRSIAHEMVHRKQDEIGLLKDTNEDGKTGSKIENQANAIAGILLRNYGKENRAIYSEGADKVVKFKDVPMGGKFVVTYPGFTTSDTSKVTYKKTAPGAATIVKVDGRKKDSYGEYQAMKGGYRFTSMRKVKIAEDITLKVNKGDTILTGKFKNKKTQVKDIGKDDHGMPTINGRVATTFRYSKDTVDEDRGDIKVPDYIEVLKIPVKNLIGYSLARAEVLGGIDFVGLAKKRGVPPLVKGDYKLEYHNNRLLLVLTRSGKLSIKVKSRTLPNYLKDITKVAKDAFIMYFKKLGMIKESQILSEGGAAGHMAHPFDDMQLTFGDLKSIIQGALNGNLGVVKEKLDGQALAISWKAGRLIAARNKGHLKNAGANAMGINDVIAKFAGRGGLSDAYAYAVKDLNAAISGLSNAQRDKVFDNGKCFMNLEVIWPKSVNVIPYGQPMLVFHGTSCYDENGNAISSDSGSARTLAGMIKQINANVQSKYTITGPPIVDLPKNQSLNEKQGQYMSKLNKLQSQFKLKDSDTVSLYHEKWWADFIDKKSPVKVDKLTKDALVRRWAFGDKSFKLNTISNQEIQDWAMNTDKTDVIAQLKKNIKPFEEIFLQVGADVLMFISSAVTVNPDAAVRNMKDRLKSTAEKVRGMGDAAKLAKLKSELDRLKTVGGKNSIVPIEGLVFTYKGNIYKLTGSFASLNQILGLFY